MAATPSKSVPASNKDKDAATTEAAVVKTESENATNTTDTNRADTATEGDGVQPVNPAATPGDNLAPRATLTDNPAALPASGTGYHCGVCGQPIGAEGQHYRADGEQVTTPHAQTLVVADDWPAKQDQADAEQVQQEAAKKASRAEK